MSNRFARGKHAFGFCDICGFRSALGDLKPLVIKMKVTNILACKECWNEDHPQLRVGMYPVYDPQALRNPRPDLGLEASRDIDWDPVEPGEQVIYLQLENGNPIQLENGVSLETE